MFLKVIEKINSLNDWIFSGFDGFVLSLPAADWIKDAIIDSFHMLPFLILIFFAIGFFEYYASDKMNDLAKHSQKTGPLVGSLIASVPQCGFSVIASTLYARKLVTTGTLLAVYLSTSDEAIPVLLSEPSKLHLVLPIIGTKIIIAIIAGYLIDFIVKDKKSAVVSGEKSADSATDDEEGCCHHSISPKSNKNLWFHPIMHTMNVFLFVLAVTLLINYAVFKVGGEENLGQYFLYNSPLQPVITGIVGLIPNCAVSIAITLMYIKGAIGFGAVISGLCSSAGLGILVLLRKNEDIKDTIRIVGLLLAISIISGLIIQFLYN